VKVNLYNWQIHGCGRSNVQNMMHAIIETFMQRQKKILFVLTVVTLAAIIPLYILMLILVFSCNIHVGLIMSLPLVFLPLK